MQINIFKKQDQDQSMLDIHQKS